MTDLFTRMANAITDVADRLEDEGDRVYLGSTNDADLLRSLREEWFATRIRALPAAPAPDVAGLVEALNREPSLIWIIENTTQVRIRDLAIDMLEQTRAALAKIGGPHD